MISKVKCIKSIIFQIIAVGLVNFSHIKTINCENIKVKVQTLNKLI